MKRYIFNYLYNNRKNIRNILFSLVVGSLLGIIFFIFFEKDKTEINNFVLLNYNNAIDNLIDNNSMIINSIINDILFILIIWAIAYIPIGNKFVYLFSIFKGFTIGYSLCSLYFSIFFNEFIKYFVINLIPKLITIINIIYINNESLKYNIERFNYRYEDKRKFFMHLISLIVSIMLSIIATNLEVYFSLRLLIFLKKIV